MLQISLFGELAITRNGSKLEGFRTHKVAALLTILAAEPEIEHRREALMTLLWPGMPESSARSNLRQVLFHLRRAIPDFDTAGGQIPLLIANRNTIRLNPEAPVSIDTLEFTRLLEKVRTHDHFDVFSCQICGNRMSEAADRYTGRFLADFFLDDSIEFEIGGHPEPGNVSRNPVFAGR